MENTTEDQSNQFLTFRLGEETFALEIGKVREVLDFTTVTRVPNMPGYMCGVINLRGRVVPVVDLRTKFGLSELSEGEGTCIIISEIRMEGEETIAGALADSVQEVLDLEAEEIESPPSLGNRLNTAFIRGIGKKGERFIIILDIDRVFSEEELEPLQTDADTDIEI